MRISTLTVGDITVTVTAKSMKNMRLSVKDDGSVKLSVPYFTSKNQIERFITANADWIKAKQICADVLRQRYTDGEWIFFRGSRHKIRVISGTKNDVAAKNGKITVYLKPSADSETEIKKFMREDLKQRISALLPEITALTGITPNTVTVRDMKRRWGSCTVKSGDIRISLKLAQKSDALLRHVLVHEIIHIKVPNHQKEFKKLINLYSPQTDEIKNEMKY